MLFPPITYILAFISFISFIGLIVLDELPANSLPHYLEYKTFLTALLFSLGVMSVFLLLKNNNSRLYNLVMEGRTRPRKTKYPYFKLKQKRNAREKRRQKRNPYLVQFHHQRQTLSKKQKKHTENYYSYPIKKQDEIVKAYWVAREKGLVANRDAWAKYTYNISGNTLRSYERAFLRRRETETNGNKTDK